MDASPEAVLSIAVAVGLQIALLLLERLMNVVLTLLLSVVFDSGTTATYPAMQALGAGVAAGAGLLSAVALGVLQVLRSLFELLWRWSVVFAVCAVVCMVYEEMPDVTRSLGTWYNTFLGPLLQHRVVVGIRLLHMALQHIIPVFNMLVNLPSQLALSLAIPGATQTAAELLRFSEHVAVMVYRLTASVFTCVFAIHERTRMCSELGDACFEVVRLDLEHPLAKLPDATASALGVVFGLCPVLQVPVDLVVYPLMDSNCARAVHHAANAALTLLVELPRVTAQRCKRWGSEAAMHCLPDVRRVFEETAAAVRAVGTCIDNWLDMTLVIVEKAVGRDVIECVGLDRRVRSPVVARELFGSNATVMVGISTSLVAVTDGTTIQFIEAGRAMADVVSPLGDGWPIEVDVALGVAVVSLPTGADSSGEGTGLLGCRCTDDHDKGMSLTCAVAPHYEATAAGMKPQIFDVHFQVATTAKYMTCAASRISVQSIRWPSTRYTTLDPAAELLHESRADAAIWVMPLCGTSGPFPAVCLGGEVPGGPDVVFTEAACFPYCMALHERGSVNQDLVLFSSREWEEYVHLLGRDCTMGGVRGGEVPATATGPIISPVGAFTYVANAILQPSLATREWTGGGCVASALARSVVPISRHAAYNASLNSVRMRGQPFAFAGDVAVVGEYDDVARVYSVTVYRLTGNGRSEYTLKRVVGSAPANPPLEMLSDFTRLVPPRDSRLVLSPAEAEALYSPQQFTLPYRWADTAFAHNPAAQTEDAVFFAVNPALHMFRAIFEYCADVKTREFPRTQLAVLSSYAPIQITRLRPHSRDGTMDAMSVEVPGRFTDVFKVNGGLDCRSRFTVAVTSLEYIDTENVAATVINTTLGGANVLGPGTVYQVGYVNPRTMRFRWDVPWELPMPPQQASDSSVRVCPGLRRMPNLGSMLAEASVAQIALLRMVVEAPLGFAGMVPLWKRSVECPLVSRGHTQLQRCAAEMLSLEDAFAALYRANRHFWRSLSYFAEFLQFPGGEGVQDLLHGMNYYGPVALRPFLYGAEQRLVQSMQVPVMERVSGAATSMMQSSTSSLLLSVGKSALASPIVWAWYFARLLAAIVMDIVPYAVHGDDARAWASVWVNIYESQGSLSELVLADAYMGCSGLAIMLGYRNPWAQLLLHTCEVPVKITEGTLALTSALFVDVGFTACVCVNSAGENFRDHVMTRCYAHAPRHLQPLLNGWLQSSGEDQNAACVGMRSLMQRNIESAMDPVFASLEAAAVALGGSIDYLRIGMDDDAGQCLNVDTDPFVVAIMPQPMDYFRVCGATSLCEQRCAGEIAAFEDMVTAPVTKGLTTYTRNVRSPFFAVDNADSRAPMQNVLSVLEINCAGVGRGRPCVGRCVAILGIGWDGTGAVKRYCVPFAPGDSVRLLSEWSVPAGPGFVTWSLGRFLDITGASVLLVTTEPGSMLMLGSEDVDTLWRWDVVEDRLPGLRQVFDLHASADGLVFMSVLLHDAGTGDARVKYVTVLCSTTTTTSCEFILHGDRSDVHIAMVGHHVVWTGDNTALLLPAQASQQEQAVSLMLVERLAVPPFARVASVTAIGLTRSFAYDAGVTEFYELLLQQEAARPAVGNARLAQNCMLATAGRYRVFSTDAPSSVANWLADVVVETRDATARSLVSRQYAQEAEISVSVQRRCDRLSCEGCVALDVQRRCYVMQQCIVARCVGTLVNQREPLCAVGLTIQQLFLFSVNQMRGVWLVIAETTADSLGLVFGDREVEVTWPDDAFFSLVCVAKDASATAVSVLTATVNNFVQDALAAPLDYVQTGALRVDSNLRAVFTMSLTALNSLFFQIALAPLYLAIVMQKVVVCETNSLMVFTDALGLNVTIGDQRIQEATGSLVGQCLPTSEDAQDLKREGSADSVANTVGEILHVLGFIGRRIQIMKLATIADAAITWFVGVVAGMQDVVQSTDMAHCKMPDFYMSDVYTCACGDTAVTIVPARRTETYMDSAFWCSGALRMLTEMGDEVYVFNPYSMEQLTEFMQRDNVLDRYLMCVSRPDDFAVAFPQSKDVPCEKLRPFVSQLERQGVTATAVWGRCRANYNLKEWDSGAFALFGEQLRRQVPLYNRASLPEATGACLTEAHRRGEGPDACLRLFLAERGETKERYFAYAAAQQQGSSYLTDACHVFSGPAATGAAVFRQCLDEYEDEGCEIAPFVWNAKSSNRVSVASAHVMELASQADREALARVLHAQAHSLAARTLSEVANYSNDRLEAFLFSVEGDFLHQLFDCAVMGAFERVDLWPQSAFDALPVPSWWRSLDGGRGIPECKGADLDGDNVPPFTCGSQTRRGVIKDFVRRAFNSNTRAGGSLTAQLVREQIAAMQRVWANVSRYACECPRGGHALACCKVDDPDTFTPGGLRTDFDTVSSEAVGAGIAGAVAQYWRDMQTRTEPWWTYVAEAERESWQWGRSEDTARVAADAGVYSTTRPLLHYNGSEVGGAFAGGTESLWDTCTGLLAQPMSTLPLAMNSSGWFVLDVDARAPFTAGSEAAFVRGLRQLADVHSPLGASRDWRHVPSNSAVCARRGRAKPLKGTLSMSAFTYSGMPVYPAPSETATLHGPAAFRLGAVDCMCGWYHASKPGVCVVPDELCVRIGRVLQEAVRGLCAGNVREYSEADDVLLRAQMHLVADGEWAAIPCPMLAFSDHWGVLTTNAITDWLSGRNVQLDAKEVLLQGRGGLRIGSWKTLATAGRRFVTPANRTRRLFNRDTGADEVSQPVCVPGAQPADIDERRLVPMAQLVHASLPVESCSMYVVEAIRFRMLGTQAMGVAAGLQELSMQRWERRCNAHLHLLSTCEHFGVFEQRPDPGRPAPRCPFSVAGSEHYITAGCVVYLFATDAFVDPCRCGSCDGERVTEAALIRDLARCRLPVDPRSMAQGWGAGVPRSFVDDLLGRLEAEHDQEGHAGEMPAEETCDGIVDWWPDTWVEPVGFHVTAPCHPSEAAYRVFDSAFAVHYDGDNNDATVRYHADALRDPQKRSVNFGTTGLCRRSNYGMPLFDINTVRVCTRRAATETFDPMVPRRPSAATAPFTAERCGESSFDVPWTPLSDAAGPELAVGMLPMWDGVSTMLPSESKRARTFTAGVSRSRLPAFWTSPACARDSDCVAMHGATLRCVRRVCVPREVQCTRHADCRPGALCSGMGTCERSRVELQNDADFAAEWQVFADDCGDNVSSVPAAGVSPWGRIQKLLPAHGFCGYHEWYDYRRALAAAGCTSAASCSQVVLHRGSRWDSSSMGPSTVDGLGLLHMLPHACDRDYHTAFARQCRLPGRPSGTQYRTFDENGRAAIARMPNASAPSLGFLALPDDRWVSSDFRRCDNVMQCVVRPFTWNFSPVQRKKPSAAAYGNDEIFQCGASRYVTDGGQCAADAAVVPFFDALCSTRAAAYAACEPVLLHTKLETTCARLRAVAGMRVQTSDNDHNAMFGVFREFDRTFAAYKALARCAEALHVEQPVAPYGSRSNSVYYAFPYSLYEVPFAWWYSCSLLFGHDLSSATKRTQLSCEGWERASSSMPSGSLLDWAQVVMRVRLLPNLDVAAAQRAALENIKNITADVRAAVAALPLQHRVRQCHTGQLYGRDTRASVRDGVNFCFQTRNPDSEQCLNISVPDPPSRVALTQEKDFFDTVMGHCFEAVAVDGLMSDVPYHATYPFPEYMVRVADLTEADLQAIVFDEYGEERCTFEDEPRRTFNCFESSPSQPILYRRADIDPLIGDALRYAGLDWRTRVSLLDSVRYGLITCEDINDNVLELPFDLYYWTCPATAVVDDMFRNLTLMQQPGIATSRITHNDGRRLGPGVHGAMAVLFPQTPCRRVGSGRIYMYPEMVVDVDSTGDGQGTYLLDQVETQTVKNLLSGNPVNWIPPPPPPPPPPGWDAPSPWEPPRFAGPTFSVRSSPSRRAAGLHGSNGTAGRRAWSGVNSIHQCWKDYSHARNFPQTTDALQNMMFPVCREQISNPMCSGFHDCLHDGVVFWSRNTPQSASNPFSRWLALRDWTGFTEFQLLASSSTVDALTNALRYVRYHMDVHMAGAPSRNIKRLSGRAMRSSAMFAGANQSTFPSFDASANVLHDRNLLRDAFGNVLCVEGVATDWSKTCSFDGGVRALHRHVATEYAESGPPVAAPGNVTAFDGLPLAQYAHVVAWADAARDVALEYFLDGSVCAEGDLLNAVCYGEDARPVNPWMGGDFNAFVGCDTDTRTIATETIDGTCSAGVCADTGDAFFTNMPSSVCMQHGLRVPGQPRHNARAATNLCFRMDEVAENTSTCAHRQGLLGGGKGRRAVGLYDRSDFACNQDSLAMYSGGVSVLFTGKSLENACLKVDGGELGGHVIRLALDKKATLRVKRVLLRPGADVSSAADWLPSLEAACARDDAEYERVYNGSADDWSAPLQRVAFWTSTHAYAKPLVPDPSRSRLLFAHLNVSKHAHPAQTASVLSPTSAYYTTNGYCICNSPRDCESMITPECTVANSILALVDGQWRTSTMVAPGGFTGSPATIDWPLAPGTLRDGHGTGRGVSSGMGILDRIPAFQLRYRGDFGISDAPAGATTLSPGGDCHMGRAAEARAGSFNVFSGACVLVQSTATEFRFRCDDGSVRTLPRARPRPPSEVLAAMRRRRRKCGECSTPKMDSRFDEPEVSFGVPYKVSPVRKWLRAMQDALAAANISDTVVRDMSASRASDRRRFVTENMRGSAQDVHSPAPDHSALFETEWLFCKNGDECSGSMPWGEWRDWDGRVQMCSEYMLALQDSDDMVVPLQICDIDRRLDAMCSGIAEAKQLVANGNCIAAGGCVTTPFFYTPSMFSVSNNDFVRMTVRNFYRMYDAEVCPIDEATAELVQQNSRLQAECASVALEKVKQAVASLRTIVHTLARMVVYFFNLVVALLRLLVSFLGLDDVLQDIAYWFKKLLESIKDLLVQIGQVLYRMVFELSPLGAAIKAVVLWVCEMVNKLLTVVHFLMCDVVRPVIQDIIDGLMAIVNFTEGVLNDVCFWSGDCGFRLNKLRDIVTGLGNLLLSGTMSFCANDVQRICEDLFKSEPAEQTGALPMPTRCWAEYVPVAGASTQLSCSRADTCLVAPFSEETVACDNCELQPAGVFQDFGCDLLTKFCTCKTQARSITFCTQNEQCSLDASCLLVDSATASASWGVDMCSNCRSEAVCVFDGTFRLGRCVCPYKPARLHSCSDDSIGGTPFFNPVKECLFTFADIQTGGVDYFAMESLAVVPCAILKPVKVVCSVVGVKTLVVGYEILDSIRSDTFGARRLLSAAAVDFFGENASDAHDELAAAVLEGGDWNRTADPCRSLVFAHRQRVDLGPVDIHKLRSCVFWRTVARMTPGVEDTMLLSFDDFVAATIANVSAPVRLLHSLRPLAVNTLLAWPEARAVLELARPAFDRNATWGATLQQLADWMQAHRDRVFSRGLELHLLSEFARDSGLARRRLLSSEDDISHLSPAQLAALDLSTLGAEQVAGMGIAKLSPEQLAALRLDTLAPSVVPAVPLAAMSPAQVAAVDLGALSPAHVAEIPLGALSPAQVGALDLGDLRAEQVATLDLTQLTATQAAAVDLSKLSPDALAGVQIASIAPDVLLALDVSQLSPEQLPALDFAGVPPEVLQGVLAQAGVPYGIVASQVFIERVGAGDTLPARPQLSDGTTAPRLAAGRFPPAYEYWVDADGDGMLDAETCPAAAIVLDEILEQVTLVRRYFTEGVRRLPLENRTLAAALPKLPRSRDAAEAAAFSAAAFAAAAGSTRLGGTVMFLYEWALGISLGMSPSNIAAVIECTADADEFTLCNILQASVGCDVEAVQLCTRHKRELLWSLLLVAALYAVLTFVLAAIGLPLTALLLWATLPLATMWYAYGYSPACVPMVPTCLLEDLVAYVHLLLPHYVTVPAALQNVPKCWNNSAVPARACFKSCVSHPEFNYGSVTATAAWVACEALGPAACAKLRLPVDGVWLFGRERFHADLAHKARALAAADGDPAAAQRLCFVVGLVYSMPYVLVLAAAVYVAWALVALPLHMLYAGVHLALQVLFFTHVRAAEGI